MNREKTNPDAPDIATGPRDGADIAQEVSTESLPASDTPTRTPVSGERTSDAERAARAEEPEKADLENRLLRALAELENFRRRAERERMEAVRFAAAQLIQDLLPTADNLSRALDSLPADRPADEHTVQQLRAGVIATERGLQDAFAKHGISKIQPVLGDPFDPHRHQALIEVERSDYPGGTVVQVLLPGYTYHERLLRPALVGVAKRRSEPAPPK